MLTEIWHTRHQICKHVCVKPLNARSGPEHSDRKYVSNEDEKLQADTYNCDLLAIWLLKLMLRTTGNRYQILYLFVFIHLLYYHYRSQSAIRRCGNHGRQCVRWIDETAMFLFNWKKLNKRITSCVACVRTNTTGLKWENYLLFAFIYSTANTVYSHVHSTVGKNNIFLHDAVRRTSNTHYVRWLRCFVYVENAVTASIIR